MLFCSFTLDCLWHTHFFILSLKYYENDYNWKSLLLAMSFLRKWAVIFSFLQPRSMTNFHYFFHKTTKIESKVSFCYWFFFRLIRNVTWLLETNRIVNEENDYLKSWMNLSSSEIKDGRESPVLTLNDRFIIIIIIIIFSLSKMWWQRRIITTSGLKISGRYSRMCTISKFGWLIYFFFSFYLFEKAGRVGETPRRIPCTSERTTYTAFLIRAFLWICQFSIQKVPQSAQREKNKLRNCFCDDI